MLANPQDLILVLFRNLELINQKVCKHLCLWSNQILTYRANNCVPEPRHAEKSDLFFGNLKTSPWIYFHPVSSWSSADSSSWAYLRQNENIIRQSSNVFIYFAYRGHSDKAKSIYQYRSIKKRQSTMQKH